MVISKGAALAAPFLHTRVILVKKSFSFWQFSVLLLVCTAVLSTGIFLYVNRLSTLLHNDMQTYLSEVAKQGVNTIEAKVQGDLNLLKSIATAIGTLPEPDEKAIIPLMKAETKANNFKRMGFVYPDGMAVLSDDLLLDISQEEHFQKAMQGQATVSNLIIDAADGQRVVVETTPVQHNGKTIGVLFATRATEEYAEALNIPSFGGEGYSIVVQANGDKIIGAQHKNAVSGFYNIFNSPDDPTHQLAQDIQKNFQHRKSGTIHYHSAERGELHISYEPVNVNDWYLLSVVPTARLSAQLNTFITLLLILCLAVAIAGLLVWGYIFLQQKRTREMLFSSAYIDPVTGFPNSEATRPLTEKLLNEQTDTPYAIVAMDVSKFKIFNEQYGYEAGNTLLKHIANTIQENLQKGEICTRIYGDYFALLLHYTSEGSLKNRLELLGEQITTFQADNHQTYPLLISFGVYPVTDRSMPLRVMYNRATVAKSRVKGRYNEIVAFYHPSWQQTLEEEDFIERHMQQAISKGQMRFLLEPIVSLSDGKIGAAMALARWHIPHRQEPLAIEQFLPVFRKNGFIFQFERFLFEAACKTLAQWKKENIPLIHIVVNFSNELLCDGNFVQQLSQKTASYGIENQWLVLELTETAQTDFLPQLQQAGKALRAAGFGLTVRYEGKGVTLANIFQHLPVEGIKVAPGIWTPEADEKQRVIAQAMTEICRKLKIFLAADGVKTPAEREHIKWLGFQYALGEAEAPVQTPEALAQQLRQAK